jgi:hypothetical protein
MSCQGPISVFSEGISIEMLLVSCRISHAFKETVKRIVELSFVRSYIAKSIYVSDSFISEKR